MRESKFVTIILFLVFFAIAFVIGMLGYHWFGGGNIPVYNNQPTPVNSMNQNGEAGEVQIYER